MKRKVFTSILLMLMLTSILSTVFIIKPSTAGNFESPELFLEEESKGYEDGFFERELDIKQDEALENLDQTPQNSQKSEDEWNFDDTSEWSNFVYKDGDKTRLIVGVNGEYDSLPKLEEIATEHQAQIVNTVSIKDEIQAAIVELPWTSMVAFVEDVRWANLATYIEPDMKVETQFVPNDPYWTTQWGPQIIEADWAWNTSIGDSSILVAIVDTGIDYTHSDLASNYVALGYDWVNIDNDPMDDQGHGTHCAGIVAAVINNSMGISGLAQVRVMTEKVLDSGGSGYWDWIANGIIHATDAGADIISMSLSGGLDSELFHDAVKYAYDSGVLVVAAASNYDSNAPRYPAYYDEVIAVAATDQYDNKASFSNWGEWIELAAPGVDIFSTVPGGYAYKDGTSMACPHVAGVAALMWSQHPNKTRDWVRLWLRYTAEDLGDVGFDIYYGYGRINARTAVEQSPPAHELIAYEWSTPSYVEPGASEIINATVLNFGDNNETDVLVQLLANGTVVNATIIELLTAGDSASINLYWNPTLEGLYNVTLYIVPVPGETSLENNLISEYVFVGFPITAFVLSSAGNFIGEIITNWQVLNSEWHRYGDSMIYIDYETLNKEDITYEDIVATNADVLIISCASDPGWEFTDSEIEAIGRYVHEGHGLIATAGTLYYQVPNNNKLAPLFGLEESIMWGTAGTDLMHLVNASHPLFTDIPDPFVFPYAGTSLPWDGRWDSNELTGGEYLALGHYQESSIVEYRGLVYISSLLEIAPVHYHHHLQLLYNAITWSRYQKPEHELAVSLETPPYLQPGESTQLNASVFNFGTNNETDVDIFLLIDDITVNSTTIPELVSGESYELTYSWNPLGEGMYNVTVNAPPVPNEESTNNNVQSNIVYVHFVRYVLFDQTHGTDNILSYDVWVTDLTGRGYVVDTLATTPLTLPMLEMYDVFVVPQAHSYYSSDELAAIQGFVSAGGGLLVIGDDSPSIYTDLTSFIGISWISGGTSGVTTDITPHEVTLGVSSVYLISPVAVMNVLGVAQDLVRDPSGNIVLAVSEYVGRAVGFADEHSLMDSGITQEDNLLLASNMIDWLVRPRLEHDLAAYLAAPVFLRPGDSSLLNATVYNRGLNNETGVEMQLLINGSEVESVIIPELLSGSSYTLSHLWTPTVEAMYNVTVYALPVAGENLTMNNWSTEFTRVASAVWIGIIETHGETLYNDDLANYYTSLGHIVEKIATIITIEVLSDYDIVIVGESGGAWLPSEIAAVQLYTSSGRSFVAIGDQLSISIQEILNIYGISYTGVYGAAGSTVNFDPLHPITQGVSSIYAENPVNSLQVTIPAYPIVNDTYNTHILIAGAEVGGYILCLSDDFAWNTYDDDNEIMFENIVYWMAVQYDHELVAYLDVPVFLRPGDSSLLNATVYNRGLNNETGVEMQLLINGSVVGSVVVPELLRGSSYTLGYLWAPTVEAAYNVTVYVVPVLGENVTANNILSKMVYVRYVDVALISDGSELLVITSILDSMGIGYDIYNDNYIYLYTEDLALLTRYPTVIFYQYNRLITSDEHSVLQSYLYSGGNLLVTGYDSLGNPSDPLLADVTRSSSTGDNTGEPDLYVVNSSHPIMSGPYGSFPAGYHISSLYSDCDAAEADIGRNAVTVAELADGYDKIIATEGLPGKVVYWNGIGCDDWMWNVDCEAMFKNTIAWLMIQYEHELIVFLDAPTFLKPGNSSLLNATLRNYGLSNETDVELQLLINGTEVESVIIPELLAGSFYTLCHLWTPTVKAMYNVTAYAPPVTGENNTANNIHSKNVAVTDVPKILAYVEYADYGQEFMNALTAIDSTFGSNYLLTELWDYTQLGSMLSGNDILFVPEQEHASLSTMEMIGASWSTTLSNFMAEGGIIIICDHSGGSYGILSGAGLMSISGGNGITGSTVYLVDPLDPLAESVSNTFIAPNGARSFITTETNVVFYDGTYPVVIHKTIGLGQIALIGFDYYASNDDADKILGNAVGLWMAVQYDHELVAYLAAPVFLMPGDSSLLNATVYNRGLNNETGVEMQLLINGSVVGSVVVPELLRGSSYTLGYLWAPTVEAAYNVTVYVVPVPGENVTVNNIISKQIIVSSYLGTYLAVIPSVTTLVIGESFTISVDLSNVTNLYGFDIWLSWDPALLDYMNHTIHIPVEDYPQGILHEPILLIVNEVDETMGTYNLVCTSLGSPSYNGSGIVFEMTFQAYTVGSFVLDIFSSDLASRQGQTISHIVFNGMGEIVESSPILRDVAINNVTVSHATVHAGHTVNITVIAENMGNAFETFNTTVYYGNASIGTQTIVRLAPGEEMTLIFVWNTTGLQPFSNYTLWAEASVVPGETNIDNNIFIDGTLKIHARGDLNGDDRVDIFDIILAVAAYHSQPGDPNWNPAADFAPIWGRIDIFDLVTIVSLFGTY